MAAFRWQLAGTVPRSLLFLSAMVLTALFAGLTAASGSRYLAWMDERARRLVGSAVQRRPFQRSVRALLGPLPVSQIALVAVQ